MPTRTHRLALRARVTAGFAALALLLSVGLAAFAYEVTRSFLVDRRETTIRQEAFVNARSVRDALALNPLAVREALSQAQADAESAVVLRIGQRWFGTTVGVGRDAVPRSLRRVVAAGDAATQRTDLATGPYVGVGVPLPAVDADYFQLISVRELDDTLSLLARSLVAAAAVFTLLGAVLGRYASGRVLRPVRRMAVTAGGIGEGALDESLDAEGDGDLEPLVDSFNSMVAALRLRIDREARFASDVSHELRTPLATMSAALSVARRRGPGAEQDAALDTLHDELARFNELVLGLLEISRMQAGVAEIARASVDPAQLVRDVLTSTHRDDVVLRIKPTTPTAIELDPRRFAQVLTNLLDNADAYGGGATEIGLSGGPNALFVCVDDSGPGVAPEDRDYVFERFARGETAAEKPGTGLGLALVAEHVRLHGGTTRVEESPTGGARFVIELPRSPT